MTPAQPMSVAPSRQLAVLLCAMHLAAAGAVWLAPTPLWARTVFALAIAANLLHCLVRHCAPRSSGAIVALAITEEGRISLQTRRGEWLECEVLGSTFVSRRLTIIDLRPHGQRRARHLIIMPDSVDAREFRRLRVWLRWAHNRVSRAT